MGREKAHFRSFIRARIQVQSCSWLNFMRPMRPTRPKLMFMRVSGVYEASRMRPGCVPGRNGHRPRELPYPVPAEHASGFHRAPRRAVRAGSACRRELSLTVPPDKAFDSLRSERRAVGAATRRRAETGSAGGRGGKPFHASGEFCALSARTINFGEDMV